MNLSRESLPDRCPGQRSWHYDRAEIIADGVVHATGVCLGLIGAVTMLAFCCLQHVAGLARQVGSASLRPLRDLFADRRNLHAILGADEKRSGFGKSRYRRLAERCHRYDPEARTSRAVRSPV